MGIVWWCQAGPRGQEEGTGGGGLPKLEASLGGAPTSLMEEEPGKEKEEAEEEEGEEEKDQDCPEGYLKRNPGRSSPGKTRCRKRVAKQQFTRDGFWKELCEGHSWPGGSSFGAATVAEARSW